MVKEWFPVLINTVTWDAYTWDQLEIEMNEEVLKMIHNKDIEGLYNMIKKDISNHYNKDLISIHLKDIIDSMRGIGIISTRDPVHQEVITALIS